MSGRLRIEAIACFVSDKPGCGGSTSFTGHLPEKAKCGICLQQYSIDYNENDKNRMADFEDRLFQAAQTAVTANHKEGAFTHSQFVKVTIEI